MQLMRDTLTATEGITRWNTLETMGWNSGGKKQWVRVRLQQRNLSRKVEGVNRQVPAASLQHC